MSFCLPTMSKKSNKTLNILKNRLLIEGPDKNQLKETFFKKDLTIDFSIYKR